MSEKKVGHVYQISYDLGNGRTFSANGNFAEDASEDDMYQAANKVLNVADRIRSRCEIDLLKTELEVRRKYLTRVKEDLRTYQTKAKRTPSDENQITSLLQSAKKVQEDVDDGERNLQLALAKAKGSTVMEGTEARN